MNILVTGARGFIASNLITRLKHDNLHNVIEVSRDTENLRSKLLLADVVFHLAGVNRPDSTAEFTVGNVDYTSLIVSVLSEKETKTTLVFSSSIKAGDDSEYGKSKRQAEEELSRLDKKNINIVLLRLPNIFGKWAKPNYNSVVATFCHNISHDLPVKVHDESIVVDLVYIDDLVDFFLSIIASPMQHVNIEQLKPVYFITVGELKNKIEKYKKMNTTSFVENVGVDFDRCLYATYLSHLPVKSFSRRLDSHPDHRGVFAEIVKTKSAGQISFFTAKPGVTRGGHYHHTKSEKFLVVSGQGRFKFKNVISGEFYQLDVSDDSPTIVDTVPGWAHNITNIGSDNLIVLLWANEVFDSSAPDTYAFEL